MSERTKKAKEIIEGSKTEEELLNNLDSLNRPLSKEELSFVNGGLGNVCNGDECGDAAESTAKCMYASCGSAAEEPVVCGKHVEECGSSSYQECSRGDYSMCSGASERMCGSLSRGICISPGF